MITQEQVSDLIGSTVYDVNGDKVGEVKAVYLDDESGRPEWMTVRTGWFGMHESFVPLSTAVRRDDRVEVSLEKSHIKDAPRIDAAGGQHLSAKEEQELYHYYGMSAGPRSHSTGMVPGQGGGPGAAMPGHPASGTSAGLASVPAQGVTGDGMDAPSEESALTLSEERLRVGTESYESGRVRLRKYVVTEEQQVTVPVTHEEVRIEREPIAEAGRGQALHDVNIEEAETEVVLHAERPVVDTEAVPVERVRLVKEDVTEQETVSGQVRKEHLETDGDLPT